MSTDNDNDDVGLTTQYACNNDAMTNMYLCNNAVTTAESSRNGPCSWCDLITT